jgi:hypothetical protein
MRSIGADSSAGFYLPGDKPDGKQLSTFLLATFVFY